MRELKFRAWSTQVVKGGQMIYMDTPNCGFGDLIETSDWKVMQYTGFKDRSGREIYEGDILIKERGGDSDFKGSVFYNTHSASYEIDGITTSGEFEGDEGYDSLSDYIDEVNVEVIGNIYENKELLDENRS